MAIAIITELPGMTQAQADAVVADLGLGGKPPAGQVLHFEGSPGGTFTAFDVWESQAAFDAFMQQQLAPLFQKHGIAGQPTVRTFEARNVLK